MPLEAGQSVGQLPYFDENFEGMHSEPVQDKNVIEVLDELILSAYSWLWESRVTLLRGTQAAY